MGAQRAM